MEVNGHWGRVVVAHDREVTGRGEILAAVAEIEREWELRGQAPASARHPANPGPGIRELAAVALGLAQWPGRHEHRAFGPGKAAGDNPAFPSCASAWSSIPAS